MARILVIEDDTEILENIEEVLKLESFRLLIANDSHAGLELAKAESPDLVICDVILPKLDGFSVLNELRHDDTTATMPFIFLSERADRANIRLGMELGADDYLTKPFTDEELVSAVHSCLNKHARLMRQYELKLQEITALERQLQTTQELAELNGALLQKLSQGLRHPVSNITIATHMLKQDLSETDFDRYVAILEEECVRGASLLNEVSGLQEYLNPSKLNLLRGKLR